MRIWEWLFSIELEMATHRVRNSFSTYSVASKKRKYCLSCLSVLSHISSQITQWNQKLWDRIFTRLCTYLTVRLVLVLINLVQLLSRGEFIQLAVQYCTMRKEIYMQVVYQVLPRPNRDSGVGKNRVSRTVSGKNKS